MELLGKKACDVVTGFTGIITGKAEYLTGCVQYSICPQMAEGDKSCPDNAWFDESRIEVIGDGVELVKPATARGESAPGGPQRDAPKN